MLKSINDLKTKLPTLKILLRIGNDDEKASEKWLDTLESEKSRETFVETANNVMSLNGFDGIDLAYEFPKIRPAKVRNVIAIEYDYNLKIKFLDEIQVRICIPQSKDVFWFWS